MITRFGLPRILTFDYGTQLDCATLRNCLEAFKIGVAYSLVGNPQCNGQAKATNKQILNGLKKKLEEAKGKWVEKIYDVL